MKAKFQEEKTLNARIKIDYRGKKPKVTFRYPDQKNQVVGSMLPHIKLWVLLLLAIGSLFMPSFFNLTEIEKANTLLIGVAIYFILPYLIYYPFKKRWNKLYPRWQGFKGKSKFMDFKSKDVQDNEKGIYCEIPLFQNLIMDYNATEDFSKYLDFIEIEEYKFYTKRYRLFSSKKPKKKVNEFIWYGRFYFNKKPKKGMLKTRFK